MKKLWIRTLSCGHTRDTSVAYACNVYDKPKIGEKVYCRKCWELVKVVRVDERNKK